MSGMIISASYFPRYKMIGRYMTMAVAAATKRVLYDDMQVTMEEISAADCARITGGPKEKKRRTRLDKQEGD